MKNNLKSIKLEKLGRLCWSDWGQSGSMRRRGKREKTVL